MLNIQPQNILIRCPNWVGDLVMCTPALRSIRAHFHKAKISIIVKPSLRNIVEDLPFIDAIIEYDHKGRDRGIRKYLSFIKKLRAQNYDLGIAMTNSFSSAQLLFLAAIPVRIGYDRNVRGWMFTHKKAPEKRDGKIIPVNKVNLYLGLCELIGCPQLDTRTELATHIDSETWVDDFFHKHGIIEKDRIVILIPGASYGPSKCWPEEYFAQVADELIRRYQAKVLILPGPGELSILKGIKAAMSEKVMDMGETVVSLNTLMALIRRCSLLITNDTGPRHFGVAFDKPVIVIMGPTDSRHTDCNLEKTIVLQEAVDCGPCHLRECPTDHKCMRLITPEKVLAATNQMVQRYNL